jgi:Glycosyl transferase WecG/TagA/CpsF family
VGDSAVEVRQSTWTASLPGERHSAWITSYLRTVVAADGICAVAAGSIALVVRFNNWASVPLEYLIFTVILPVLWWTSVALAHGYEARFIGAGRRSFMGRAPTRRSSLRVPVLPGRRDEVQMLRGSDSPRAIVSRHGGSARLAGLDFDRLTEETGAPPVGFDADPQTVAAVRARIAAAAPGIVYVGLGFHKQEHLIAQLAPFFPATWFISCGAAIPFAVQALARAPLWMQRAGLEWMFRSPASPGGCSGGIWSMTCHSPSPCWPFPQRMGCGTLADGLRHPERIPA